MQTALGHQCEKTDGFKRDGLAAGVGAGDDERVKICAKAHRNGHDKLWVDQRVPCLLEFQAAVLADLGCRGVHAEGELSPRKDHVQPHQKLIILADVVFIASRLGGKLGKDPLNLLFLFDQKLAQGVVGVDRRHGLDKKGGACRAHVVDQTRDLVFILRFYRDHVSVLAQGNDRLAQILGVGRGCNQLLQGLFDFGALYSHMPPDIRKLGAGGVSDLFLRQNGAEDLLF